MSKSSQPFNSQPLSNRALSRIASDILALNARNQAVEEIIVARTVQRGGCATFQNLFSRLGVRSKA